MFLLMKHVLLKIIVIVMGKLTRSRVLRGGRGFVGPQETGMGQENFLYHIWQDEDRVR